MLRSEYELSVNRTQSGKWRAELTIAPGVANGNTSADVIHKLAKGLHLVADQVLTESERS